MYRGSALSTRGNGRDFSGGKKQHLDRRNGERYSVLFLSCFIWNRGGGWGRFLTQELAALSEGTLICMLYHREKPLTPSSQKSLQCRLLLSIYSPSSALYPTCQVEELNMSILLHFAEIHWEKPERCASLSGLLLFSSSRTLRHCNHTGEWVACL